MRRIPLLFVAFLISAVSYACTALAVLGPLEPWQRRFLHGCAVLLGVAAIAIALLLL